MKKLLLIWALLLIAVSAPDMSVKDVATYLRVTTRTVYVMMADGRLKAYKIGDRIDPVPPRRSRRRADADRDCDPIGEN